MRVPELVRPQRERTREQADGLGDAVALIGEVSRPSRSRRIARISSTISRGRDPVERVLHARGEPQPHEADFFRGSVHARACRGDERVRRASFRVFYDPDHPASTHAASTLHDRESRASLRGADSALARGDGARVVPRAAGVGRGSLHAARRRWSTARSSARCSRGSCTTARRTRATRSCSSAVEALVARRAIRRARSAVNVRELRRAFDRERRIPRRLVEEWARVTAMAPQAWAEARRRDDYASFAPWLDRIFALARERGGRGRLRRERATTRCSTTTSRG